MSSFDLSVDEHTSFGWPSSDDYKATLRLLFNSAHHLCSLSSRIEEELDVLLYL